MSSRYFAAKLFFCLAFLCAVVGAVLNRHGNLDVIYLVPLTLLVLPRLIPFAAAILSVCFGLVYFALEKKFKRPFNVPLTLIHLVSYLLAFLGHATMLRYVSRALSEANATNNPLPVWASLLFLFGTLACCSAFVANIVWSMSRPAVAPTNPT